VDHKLFSDNHYPPCKCFTDNENQKANMFNLAIQFGDRIAGNAVMHMYCPKAVNYLLAMTVYHALTITTTNHNAQRTDETTTLPELQRIFKEHMLAQLEEVKAQLVAFDHRTQLMMTGESRAN